ncbi:MAG: NEW3 domain-containing protein, partial [Methanopyri archaeon]|nr:NEW3 domain-containing protein [Methanopyri archaeon]
MTDKKIAAGIVCALILALSAGADFLPTEPNIRVLGLSYDPAPAEPGRQVEVSIKVDNFAKNAASDLVLEVRPKYPFSLKPGESESFHIGSLAPKTEVYRKFQVIVSEDAPEDTYELEIAACPDTCAEGEEVTIHKVSIDVESGADFTLKEIVLTPDLLVPGGDATAVLTLENTGLGKAQDVQLDITTTPKGSTDAGLFYLLSSGTNRWLGDMGPKSTKKVYLSLGIGDGADGIYVLPLTITYKSKGATVTKTLELAMNVRKAVGRDLLVAGTTTDPVRIPPGGDAIVYLTLKSASDVPLRSITVGLVLSGATIPFATSQSSAERVLDSLAPGAEGTVQFDLSAAGTATPGIYKVPVGISYLDNLGERFTRMSILTLIVGSKPALDLRVAAPDLFKKGTTQDVAIEVLNAGAEEARSVVAQLLVPEGVKVLSSPTTFIESLAANAKSTLTYTIHVPEEFAAATSDLKLQLRFSDTQNHQYTEEKRTQLRLYKAGDPVGELTGEVPRLQIGLEKSPIYKAGQKGTVTLNFVNKGTENIKFLTVMVAPTDALEVLSSDRIYVG